jgi:hypothetical protein
MKRETVDYPAYTRRQVRAALLRQRCPCGGRLFLQPEDLSDGYGVHEAVCLLCGRASAPFLLTEGVA